jgi:hypothetical protein
VWNYHVLVDCNCVAKVLLYCVSYRPSPNAELWQAAEDHDK